MRGVLLCLFFYCNCCCNGLSTSTAKSHLLRQTDDSIRTRRPDRSIIQGEEYRACCRGCNRPLTQCLCEHLPAEKIGLETKVLVLQHPVEFRRQTVSTVPILKLVLEHCCVLVGRSFSADLELIINNACDEGRIPLLLFPTSNATVLEDCDAMEQLH